MLSPRKIKLNNRIRRHQRIRAKISGTQDLPRLCVFRSNKYIYGQLIDDTKGYVLAAFSESNLDKKSGNNKMARAFQVGKNLAELASKIKIAKVLFDRGGFNYQGRVRALADGAREGGLKF